MVPWEIKTSGLSWAFERRGVSVSGRERTFDSGAYFELRV